MKSFAKIDGEARTHTRSTKWLVDRGKCEACGSFRMALGKDGWPYCIDCGERPKKPRTKKQ